MRRTLIFTLGCALAAAIASPAHAVIGGKPVPGGLIQETPPNPNPYAFVGYLDNLAESTGAPCR